MISPLAVDFALPELYLFQMYHLAFQLEYLNLLFDKH